MSKASSIAAILLLCGSPALALQDTGSSTAKPSKAKDPNRMVCEKQEVIGSRLATKRVCMTEAEWAEKRLQDRMLIERGQAQARVPGGN